MFKHAPLLFLLAAAFSAQAADLPFTLQGAREPDSVVDCLNQGLRRLNLPPSFIAPLRRDDSSASLGLINPVTGNEGLNFVIVRNERGSQLTVTPNGMPLTPGWRQMIQRCVD